MKKTLTIRSRIIFSFLFISSILILLNIFLMYNVHISSQKYGNAVSSINLVNQITPLIQEDISLESYYLVTGRSTDISQLTDMLTETNETTHVLLTQSHTEGAKREMNITVRTLNTLNRYCQQLITQVVAGDSYDHQNETLEEIRVVSSLVNESLGHFVGEETEYMGTLNEEIQLKMKRLLLVNVIALGSLVLVGFVSVSWVIRGITVPIHKLILSMKQVGEGNFSVKADVTAPREIEQLNHHFNRLVDRLNVLMEQEKQQAIDIEKAKLQLLQEQINPHFLYNTLETIVWMAESGKPQRIVELVQSLSSFFRMVLNEGKSNITLKEEMNVIKNYLEIQQTRYEDILDYELLLPQELEQYIIPKLTLQPIVENALYHGLKNKRGKNKIIVTAMETEEDIVIEIVDTGIGMEPEFLQSLQQSIRENQKNKQDQGFGLSNIQQRLTLQYGEKYGISVESTYTVGTTVSVQIPKIIEH